MAKGSNVYSAFPGCGKTRATQWFVENDRFVLDSDSSKFPKERFPDNYLDHIEAVRHSVMLVFVSSHEPVRKGLVDRGIPFVLVYPDKSLKDEYLKRYDRRGSGQAFADLLDANWDDWIDQLVAQRDCEHLVLGSAEYLLDAMMWKGGDDGEG